MRAGEQLLGVVPEGNRKDIRNAVEAAVKASAWRRATAHSRAQVLYYIAENLLAHAARFTACLAPVVGDTQASAEVEASGHIDKRETMMLFIVGEKSERWILIDYVPTARSFRRRPTARWWRSSSRHATA